jgi:hypothetical protein
MAPTDTDTHTGKSALTRVACAALTVAGLYAVAKHERLADFRFGLQLGPDARVR